MKREYHGKKGLKFRSAALAAATSLSLFTVFGLVTLLIPNPFFIRMTPIHSYDYALLMSTSALSGIYAGMWYYARKTNAGCQYATAGGAIGGLFSFGCPICNKLLILLLGLGGVTAYFAPIQPLLGVVSVAAMAYAVHAQYRLLPRGGRRK